METNSVPQAEPQKNNRNIIIGVVVALVLCCCCLVTGFGGYYGYQAYVAAQQVVDDFESFEIPTDVPFNPIDPSGTPIPGFDTSLEVPSGGLADDETRLFAWANVQLIGIMSDCSSPTVEGTTITVLTQPEAGGPWREEWNVNCGDGTFKAFPLTFTPQDGVINVTVDFSP